MKTSGNSKNCHSYNSKQVSYNRAIFPSKTRVTLAIFTTKNAFFTIEVMYEKRKQSKPRHLVPLIVRVKLGELEQYRNDGGTSGNVTFKTSR